MRQALEGISRLRPVLLKHAVEDASTERLGIASSVETFICSIERKCQFVKFHRDFLCNVCWDDFGRVGTDHTDSGNREALRIGCGGGFLETDDQESAVNLVLMTFDGLVAACVNITDTFARLVNLAYSLGIPQERASIFGVRDKVSPDSPLGLVLKSSPGLDWLQLVRRIRGECQHADIVSVLTRPASPFGGPHPEPEVSPQFVPDLSEDERPISRYAASIVANTQEFLVRASSAIVANAATAIQAPPSAVSRNTAQDNTG